uniref:Uncharacterized protein n=1 Tax=Trichobilharzia regenti TaxID=157069 RepID=A0AA85JHN4_TRIRE|nr:unnamed protein product [Trichobilharzia regenti]
MSVIFTIGKKATEIINGNSSPLTKVRRANCRESKSSTSSCYQPSENVIVWNIDLDGNQVSLAYCTDTQILWCNDQQIQLQGKSEGKRQEYTFSIKSHRGSLLLSDDTTEKVPTCRLYIDGSEVKHHKCK